MRVGTIIIILLWCAWIAMFPLIWTLWADSSEPITIPLETKVEQAVEAANRENKFVIIEEELDTTNKIVRSQIEEFLNCVPEGKDIFIRIEKIDKYKVAKVYSAFSQDNSVLYQYKELYSYQGWKVRSYDANQVTFRWDNYDGGPLLTSLLGGMVGGFILFLITGTYSDYVKEENQKKKQGGVELEPPKSVPTPDIWGEEYQPPKKKEEKETITDPFEQKTLGVGS